jgi:hypothetical protein
MPFPDGGVYLQISGERSRCRRSAGLDGCNEYSNTVFFRRPSPEICREYTLALGNDERFGGELAHVVVMQQVTKEKIDAFIKKLQSWKK